MGAGGGRGGGGLCLQVHRCGAGTAGGGGGALCLQVRGRVGTQMLSAGAARASAAALCRACLQVEENARQRALEGLELISPPCPPLAWLGTQVAENARQRALEGLELISYLQAFSCMPLDASGGWQPAGGELPELFTADETMAEAAVRRSRRG